jgi:FG-GAP repeat protein/VCBS repeat protein
MSRSSLFPSSLALALLAPLAMLALGSTARAQAFVQCTRVLHTLEGEAAGDNFGWVSAPLPDLDGDGAEELVVGAPFHASGGAGAGRIYVYSGRGGGELFHADGGAPGENLGHSVRAAGDLDGDGIGDVLAGGRGSGATPGAARIYSGASGTLLRTLQVGAATDGFGYAVDGLGDVDGDGVPDLAVGAPFEDTAGADAGRVRVLSGADGSTLRTFDGESAMDNFGTAVGALADVNGDGVAELIVGAANAGPSAGGRAYVYDVAAGVLLHAPLLPDASAAEFGQFFVADVGTVDADGVADLYVGDFADGSTARGKAYVFSGATGARILTLTGQNADGFGIGRGLGDVNGDGRADLLLGSWTSGAGATRAGKLEVFSGANGALLRRVTSTTAREALGFDAHGLGDLDGDGSPELVGTAASFAQGRGRVYVIGARPLETLGTGLAGSGGLTPVLALGGCPRLGSLVTIDVSNVLGGATGVLFFSMERVDRSLFGGILVPGARGGSLQHVTSGSTGSPGAGTFSQAFSLPLAPALIGVRSYVQALYADPGAPRGVSFSPALALTTY